MILRPALVLGPAVYGGTAMLRGIAGLSGRGAGGAADARIQVIGVDDVAETVARALAPDAAAQTVWEVAHPQVHRLADIVTAIRAWLGFRPRRVVALPDAIAAVVARLADALGWLGWRSPARSTSLAQLTAGVVGDPARWMAATGIAPKSLDDDPGGAAGERAGPLVCAALSAQAAGDSGLGARRDRRRAPHRSLSSSARVSPSGSLPVFAAGVVADCGLSSRGPEPSGAAGGALCALRPPGADAVAAHRPVGQAVVLVPLVGQYGYVLDSDAPCRSLHARNSGRPLMESIFLLKFLHVLGASVLFGTGIGIAFFMLMAHRTGHAGVIAVTARFVVIADLIFTATAVVVQPVTGVALAWAIGLSPLG